MKLSIVTSADASVPLKEDVALFALHAVSGNMSNTDGDTYRHYLNTLYGLGFSCNRKLQPIEYFKL